MFSTKEKFVQYLVWLNWNICSVSVFILVFHRALDSWWIFFCSTKSALKCISLDTYLVCFGALIGYCCCWICFTAVLDCRNRLIFFFSLISAVGMLVSLKCKTFSYMLKMDMRLGSGWFHYFLLSTGDLNHTFYWIKRLSFSSYFLSRLCLGLWSW